MSTTIYGEGNIWFGTGYKGKLPEGWTLKEEPGSWAFAVDPEGKEYFVSATHAYPVLLQENGERWMDETKPIELPAPDPEPERKPVDAVIEGVDDWSRVIIKTRGGTRLCDIYCKDLEELKRDPRAGDWHTMVGDFDEPCSRISTSVQIRIVEGFDAE
jgi:hypothetical protein